MGVGRLVGISVGGNVLCAIVLVGEGWAIFPGKTRMDTSVGQQEGARLVVMAQQVIQMIDKIVAKGNPNSKVA